MLLLVLLLLFKYIRAMQEFATKVQHIPKGNMGNMLCQHRISVIVIIPDILTLGNVS